MTAAHPDIKRQDLLLQNPGSFIHEISHLVDKIISPEVPTEQKDSNLTLATEAGWQAASLIGNTFKYIVESATRLKADQQTVATYIQAACKLADAGAKTASGFSGAFANAEAGVESTIDSIGSFLARKAIKLSADLDLSKLTADMAELSDRLKILANEGFLAPGEKKLTPTEVKNWEPDSYQAHMTAGLNFLIAYEKHLRDFSTRELERESSNTTHQLEA